MTAKSPSIARMLLQTLAPCTHGAVQQRNNSLRQGSINQFRVLQINPAPHEALHLGPAGTRRRKSKPRALGGRQWPGRTCSLRAAHGIERALDNCRDSTRNTNDASPVSPKSLRCETMVESLGPAKLRRRRNEHLQVLSPLGLGLQI